jgi:hypothetical protein
MMVANIGRGFDASALDASRVADHLFVAEFRKSSPSWQLEKRMVKISSQMGPAAGEIARFLVDAYRNQRGVHSETVIGAAAALTGEFTLRAAEPKIPERGWVFSERASRIIHGREPQGEIGLWSLIRRSATNAGADAKSLPDASAVAKRVAAAVGGSPFPPLSVPDEHYPHEWSPEACPKFRAAVGTIGAKHGISGEDLAVTLALATGILITQTARVLPPAIAATLALEIMLGVSHMVPIAEPIGSGGAPPPKLD